MEKQETFRDWNEVGQAAPHRNGRLVERRKGIRVLTGQPDIQTDLIGDRMWLWLLSMVAPRC